VDEWYVLKNGDKDTGKIHIRMAPLAIGASAPAATTNPYAPEPTFRNSLYLRVDSCDVKTRLSVEGHGMIYTLGPQTSRFQKTKVTVILHKNEMVNGDVREPQSV